MRHKTKVICECEYCKMLHELKDMPGLSKEEIILCIDTFIYAHSNPYTFIQKCFIPKLYAKHKNPTRFYIGDN